eukprot:CAMPEP_0170061678 /NCGR_PEP_ID=MMETSP0019_2-20121128/3164_1 /TAXON_ID=98059 /ORGANISM="Dinobryon sp., Strain UTEXLB2267" /LENGTH=58 /DNA_ID=CAMNT_0010267585 /DNA_START=1305 /DNA_END=1481 /DNA_ORIENTATION=+
MTPLRSVLAYPSKSATNSREIKTEQDRKKPKFQAIRSVTLQDFGEFLANMLINCHLIM